MTLWACTAPARTCLDQGEALTIWSFSQASFRAMGPVELSRVLNFMALQHSPLSQLSALAEKALDVIHLSCPLVVQTQACMPSACPMSFPNVPVLSLPLTRPHSIVTLPLSPL